MSELGRDAAAVSCEAARVLLSARPDSGADYSGLVEHLSACDKCVAYQEAQHGLDRRIADVLVMEPPAWLTASILEQLSPEPSVAWRARPRINLALQWSFYLLLSGGLVLGLLVPIESITIWLQTLLALPAQLGVAIEVLMVMIGLIPLDPITSAFENATWLYESAALALVFWWLRQSTSSSEPRSHA